MNAKMKRRSPKRHRPLHRHRNMPGGCHRPQQHGSVDIVVVRNRDQRLQPHCLNLSRLQFERHLGQHRRPPERALKVQRQPVLLEACLLIPPQHDPRRRQHLHKHVHKLQRLFRTARMAVQRHSSPVSLHRRGILPPARDLGLRLHRIASRGTGASAPILWHSEEQPINAVRTHLQFARSTQLITAGWLCSHAAEDKSDEMSHHAKSPRGERRSVFRPT